jgi:hypothetical protein
LISQRIRTNPKFRAIAEATRARNAFQEPHARARTGIGCRRGSGY